MYTVRKGILLEMLVPHLLMLVCTNYLKVDIVNHLAYLLA